MVIKKQPINGYQKISNERITMILDWEKGRDYALRNGIKIFHIRGIECACFKSRKYKYAYIENVTFRNFPYLCIEEHQILNCTFENCEMVELKSWYECVWLSFDKVKKLFITCKGLRYSKFKDVESVSFREAQGPLLASFLFDEEDASEKMEYLIKKEREFADAEKRSRKV